MYVHSVILRKCVEPKALLKERCWLPYLGKCKLCVQDLEYVLYVANMLPRFYKIIIWKKEKNFIGVFNKHYGFASQEFLVVRGNSWGFMWSGRHTHCW